MLLRPSLWPERIEVRMINSGDGPHPKSLPREERGLGGTSDCTIKSLNAQIYVSCMLLENSIARSQCDFLDYERNGGVAWQNIIK